VLKYELDVIYHAYKQRQAAIMRVGRRCTVYAFTADELDIGDAANMLAAKLRTRCPRKPQMKGAFLGQSLGSPDGTGKKEF